MRIASALVLAPIAIAIAYLGGWAFTAFWTGAAVLVFREWALLVLQEDRPLLLAVMSLLIAVAAVLVGTVSGAAVNSSSVLWAIPLLVAVVIGAVTLTRSDQRIWLTAGVPYSAALAVAPIFLRSDPLYGFEAIIFIFAIVWTTDIVAFFVGRTIRGPKLAPRISPKKTWAGAVGGTFGGLAAAAVMGWCFTVPDLVPTAVLGVLLSVAGQGGDLFESALKRRFGVKDSGHLIPGHGGLMDRLDAFVAAAVVAAAIGIARGGLEAPARALLVW